MRAKELILTGYAPFFPEKEGRDVFYLGPWCFMNNGRHEFLEYKEFNVMPSPFSSKKDTFAHCGYVDKLLDRLIPPLADLMNKWYGVKFSNKFWKFSLAAFLVHFLNAFYFKYKCVEMASGIAADEKLDVKVLKDFFPQITSIHNLINLLFSSHEYNICLFSQIIKEGGFEFLNAIETQECVSVKIKQLTVGHSGKSFAEKAVNAFTNFFQGKDIFWGTVYGLSMLDRIRLGFCRKDKTAVRIATKPVMPLCDLNEWNDMEISFKAEDRFQGILKKVLLKNMPLDIISGINGLEKKEKVKYWIGNDMFSTQDKHFKIARIVENGGTWISSQHGGSYGWFYSFPLGKIDYETSANFISTGWKHKHLYDCKIIPLPSPKFSRLPRHREKNDKIIFISLLHSPYYNRLHSLMLPEDFAGYLENKKKFLSTLKERIKGKILYRRYFRDYGMNEKNLLKGLLDEKQFMGENDKLVSFLKKSRLLIIDHLMSTTLEAYAMNAPSVMYYDPEMYKVMDEIKADFDELAEAKMYFEKPEDAAEHVNRIYDDVGAWWNSEKVQKARKRFTEKYALNSKTYIKDWVAFAKSLPA